MLMNGLLSVFSMHVAFNFFKKKRAARPLMIAFLAVSVVVVFIDAIATDTLFGGQEGEKALMGVGRHLLFKGAWMLYFIRSKRVKGTFVN